MVHTAYDSIELIAGVPSPITAVAAHASKILIASTDGALRIYASPSTTDEIAPDRHVLDRTLPGFWKRAPTAMEVSREREILISLSEWIAVHRLPGLETVVAIAKTKGANVFGWDDGRGMLCVGSKKRVTIFRLDGGREFVEVKEFGVPDTVKSMAWCGENICLGYKKEYMIMNSTTGALSEVFPSGRIAPPSVIPLPSGELLLGKDNVGFIVDQNGKLVPDGTICWSDRPASVVIPKPYALGCLARHVEIRSLKPRNPLVQTIVIRDVRFLLQINNCIIAALGNSIYGLLPVPLGAQIVQLTASGDFEEALTLCKLLPPEDSTLRAAKESSIHIRYGHHLYDNGSYEEAMDQFLESQVDMTYVLSMYPSIILPRVLTMTETEKLSDMTDSAHLSRVSSDASDEIDIPPSQLQEPDDRTTHEVKKMSHNSLMALVKYLQKRRPGIIEKATAEVAEEVVSEAVQSGIGSKSSSKRRGHKHISSVSREMAAILDTALLQALLITGQSSAALELLKGPNYSDIKICEDFLKERNAHIVLLELYKFNEMNREALTLLTKLVEESNSGNSELRHKFKPQMILDYLKPLCRSYPMLVLEFSMHVLESCPMETIELFLSGNVPSDLVNSYLKQHAPNMQSTYLELMLSMSENGINPNLQNELVQIYLSEVLDWYKDLVEQHNWEEKTDSSTRRKLIAALEGISDYNAEALLKRLPSDALYEERAVLLGRMNQHQLALSLYVHKLHLSDMALSYCDRVYETEPHQSARSHANIYLTLLQIYLNPRRTSKEIDQRTINPMPSQNFSNQKIGPTKVKAGRMTRKIAEIEMADDTRISPSGTDSSKSDGDVDDAIEGGGPIMLDDALDLLNKRWDRINGAQALRLLPRDTKLQNLTTFLGPLLRKSREGLRNYSIIKSLRYNENLQVKEELYKHRRTVLKIDGDSTCSLCHKKIGSSVFAVYPNGKTLVHFICFRDSQSIKAVRGAPTTKRM